MKILAAFESFLIMADEHGIEHGELLTILLTQGTGAPDIDLAPVQGH